VGSAGVGQTGGVEIEISTDSIRLGQLLKFASVVMDGGEAKALIAAGSVSVDGEPETRRGRQVHVGSLVEVDLPQGRQELRVIALGPDPS
jgi:ribosome-associated protein